MAITSKCKCNGGHCGGTWIAKNGDCECPPDSKPEECQTEKIYHLIEMKNTATLYVSAGLVGRSITLTNEVGSAVKFASKADAQKAVDRSPEQIRPYLIINEHIWE